MGATQSIPKNNSIIRKSASPVRRLNSPVKQVRRIMSEPEAFAYFVNMHSIPVETKIKMWESYHGQIDWIKFAHEYAYIPKMASLHEIKPSKKELADDKYRSLLKYKNSEWKKGDIVRVRVTSGDRNNGKLYWTGGRLLDLDYDSVDDYGSLPQKADFVAMQNPYHWCLLGVISHNRAIPVKFDTEVAQIVNNCQKRYCIFEWNNLRWGLIIDQELRNARPILNKNGKGILFWLDITVRNPDPLNPGFYKHNDNTPVVQEMIKKGVPYERILSTTQEY